VPLPRKIVITNQSTGYLFIDIANACAHQYDEVVLLAGEVIPMQVPLDPRVRVHRIRKYNRSGTLRRILSWVIATLQISWLLTISYRKHRLLISSNPPTASTLLPLLFRRNISLVIYDIYPDALLAAGFTGKRNLLFKSWAWFNRRAYKRAEHIFTLTTGMAQALELYVPREKIKVVPVWSGISREAINIQPENNLFLRRYGLQDKFIIMYSGNLGKEYVLEPLVELAEKFVSDSRVRFIIMGSGWQKEKLAALIDAKGLQNCLLLPYQEAELFLHSLAAFQLGVVSLSTSFSALGIPSKTYNLLAAQRPILCIGNENSSLATFLREAAIGQTFEPSQQAAMEAYIQELINNPTTYRGYCEQAEKISQQYTRARALEIPVTIA